MKSSIVNESRLTKDYPKLMINDCDEIVVLFYSLKKGVVVHSQNRFPYELGKHSETWNMAVFRDFNGEVIIHSE